MKHYDIFDCEVYTVENDKGDTVVICASREGAEKWVEYYKKHYPKYRFFIVERSVLE